MEYVLAFQSENTPVTLVREWCASHQLKKPTYSIVNKGGPSHMPEFVTNVSVNNISGGKGQFQPCLASQYCALTNIAM